MKLVRHGQAGHERPGLIDDEGRIRDLGAVSADFGPAFFAQDGISRLRSVDVQSLPIVASGTRLGSCVAQPGNFIAVGLNYVRHAIESNAQIPKDPVLFNKAPSCISGPNDPVLLPKGSTKSDWEAELALVIGKQAHYVDESDALSHVAGYFVCNDVSERHYQLERSGQWVKGKMFPTFGPLGPWLVTADAIPDVQNLHIWLELNGKRIQDSSTSDMIFTVAKLVSEISQYVILQAGDVITTGTPSGVGFGMKPQQFLQPGDVMRLGIDGLGVQQQRVLRWGEQ